jgi:hypothetical protein
MQGFATLFMILAVAAGCRGDYPSLASAPDKAPPSMLEARETAFVRQAKILAASRLSSKKEIKETLLDNPVQIVSLQEELILDKDTINRVKGLVSEGKKKLVILASSSVSDRALTDIVRQLEVEGVSVKLLIFSHSADVVSNVELYLER